MGAPSPGEFRELSEGLSVTGAQDNWPQHSPPGCAHSPAAAPGDSPQRARLPGLVSLSSTPILASGEHGLPYPLCFSMFAWAKLFL